MLRNLLDPVLEILSFWNCLVALVFGWVIYRWASRKWLNLPPGPIGFPIFGSIPYLDKHAERTLTSWIKTYGPVISVDLATTRFVFLNTYEAIEEVRQCD